MPTMSVNRNLILSVVTFIKNELDDAGLTGVTFVDAFPEDNLIVTEDSATGRTGEVVLPAIAIISQNEEDGYPLGVGEDKRWVYNSYSAFIHDDKKGRGLDIRSVIKNSLTDKRAEFYDYSDVGYTIGGTAPTISGYIEFSKVRARPISMQSANAALNNAGMVSFMAEATRTISN